MENFVQRINYACIVPLRNYCHISEKRGNNGTTFNFDLDDLDEMFSPQIREISDNKRSAGMVYSIPSIKYKNTCFFTDSAVIKERIDIPYPCKNIGYKEYYTDKSTQIKRHFANPFSRITVFTYEKSIKLTEDKLTLRFYKLTKYRDFNSRFFKKNTISTTLSINLKTGNFTVGKNNGKKSKKIFVTNYFGTFLNDFIYHFFADVDNDIDRKIKNPLYDRLHSQYSVDELLRKLNEVLNFNLDKKDIKESFIDSLIKSFIEKKNIKIPNGEIKKYFVNLYPTEKFLKKNDRKLISSVLDMLGFKSKLTIKLLHLYPNLDLVSFYMLCTMLGENYSKYVGNLNPICFGEMGKKTDIDIKYAILNYKIDVELTDIERENIISVINSTKQPYFNGNNIILLDDHLRMIGEVRKFVPDVFFKSKTKEEFDKNHIELVKLRNTIKRGWSIEYIFSPKMVEDVESSITLTIDNTSFEPDLLEITPQSVSVTFYPYILKREEEYIEEGKFMHHCVASYAKKDKSIIISVRTLDGSDRVTCEYNGQDGRLMQCRHFCNASPPADMEMAVEELTKKVKKYARLGMLHAIEQKKVPVRINGIDIIIETPTDPFTQYHVNDLIFDF
jgi:hypothetical protein